MTRSPPWIRWAVRHSTAPSPCERLATMATPVATRSAGVQIVDSARTDDFLAGSRAQAMTRGLGFGWTSKPLRTIEGPQASSEPFVVSDPPDHLALPSHHQ